MRVFIFICLFNTLAFSYIYNQARFFSDDNESLIIDDIRLGIIDITHFNTIKFTYQIEVGLEFKEKINLRYANIAISGEYGEIIIGKSENKQYASIYESVDSLYNLDEVLSLNFKEQKQDKKKISYFTPIMNTSSTQIDYYSKDNYNIRVIWKKPILQTALSYNSKTNLKALSFKYVFNKTTINYLYEYKKNWDNWALSTIFNNNNLQTKTVYINSYTSIWVNELSYFFLKTDKNKIKLYYENIINGDDISNQIGIFISLENG